MARPRPSGCGDGSRGVPWDAGTRVTPIVLVLLDGLGDHPQPGLDGSTTNELAVTPHLDRFAAASSCGVVSPLGRGLAPSSELAHWTYFTGSLASFPGRAVLEAIGHGRTPGADGTVGYVALRAGHPAAEGTVRLGARPRRGDEADAHVLLEALPRGPFCGVGFDIQSLPSGDAVVVLHGSADPAISDTDSFEDDLHPLLRCEPLRGDDGAARTAAAVNAWTAACHDTLRNHHVNQLRRRRGAATFDFATSKWWGRRREVMPFSERTGLRGAVVSAAPYQGGIANLLGMEWVQPPETAPGRESLEVRLRLTRDLLANGYGFVHCHDKTADEAGHTKDPQQKIAALESLDSGLASLPPAHDDVVVMITGDHATPTGGRMLHSGDAVPFMLRGQRVAADAVRSFGERHQAAGALGHLNGCDIMAIALNAAERARFLGAHAGAGSVDAIGVSAAPAFRLHDYGKRQS